MHLTDIIRREKYIMDFILDEAHTSIGAYVFPADVAEREPLHVKNLGWLLRHAGDVKHPLEGVGFTVRGWRYSGSRYAGMGSTGPLMAISDNFDPILFAHLNDGRTYVCQWADISILHDWLNRPRFKHYTVHWDYNSSYGLGVPNTVAIGGKDYNDLPVHRGHPSRWPVAS